jgi:glutaredoxin-related protein
MSLNLIILDFHNFARWPTWKSLYVDAKQIKCKEILSKVVYYAQELEL